MYTGILRVQYFVLNLDSFKKNHFEKCDENVSDNAFYVELKIPL